MHFSGSIKRRRYRDRRMERYHPHNPYRQKVLQPGNNGTSNGDFHLAPSNYARALQQLRDDGFFDTSDEPDPPSPSECPTSIPLSIGLGVPSEVSYSPGTDRVFSGVTVWSEIPGYFHLPRLDYELMGTLLHGPSDTPIANGYYLFIDFHYNPTDGFTHINKQFYYINVPPDEDPWSKKLNANDSCIYINATTASMTYSSFWFIMLGYVEDEINDAAYLPSMPMTVDPVAYQSTVVTPIFYWPGPVYLQQYDGPMATGLPWEPVGDPIWLTKLR